MSVDHHNKSLTLDVADARDNRWKRITDANWGTQHLAVKACRTTCAGLQPVVVRRCSCMSVIAIAQTRFRTAL